MKFFVIVFCLLLERFVSNRKPKSFDWFDQYVEYCTSHLSNTLKSYRYILLITVLLPLFLMGIMTFYIFNHRFFGLFGLLLNMLVFYYCLGPENPFFPHQRDRAVVLNETQVAQYLAKANGQLFAVIFWYIITGPIGIMMYRALDLSKEKSILHQQASNLMAILDWFPAKMTALLYLLAGNFQAGIQLFSQQLFTPPENNVDMLMTCGLRAVTVESDDSLLMPQAEMLVEHALIILLALLAVFTLIAWL